jgi:hypothetical protein
VMVTTQILAVVAAEARSMSWQHCNRPPLGILLTLFDYMLDE